MNHTTAKTLGELRRNVTLVGQPGTPYSLVAQMLKVTPPRVREAFLDNQKQLEEQHDRGVQEVFDRLTGKTGFKKVGNTGIPQDAFRIQNDKGRREYRLPEEFKGVVEHLSNPTRLEDDFIFADGDAVKIVTYGAQGGEVLPGFARISTSAILNLDGAEHSFHVFPPVTVKL